MFSFIHSLFGMLVLLSTFFFFPLLWKLLLSLNFLFSVVLWRGFSLDISDASVLTSKPGKLSFLLFHQGQLSISPNSCHRLACLLYSEGWTMPLLFHSYVANENAFLRVFCELIERVSFWNAWSNGYFCWLGFLFIPEHLLVGHYLNLWL